MLFSALRYLTAVILFILLLVPSSESKPQSDFEVGYGYGNESNNIIGIGGSLMMWSGS